MRGKIEKSAIGVHLESWYNVSQPVAAESGGNI